MKTLYSTKLVSRSTRLTYPLGILLVLFGIISIILSAIDLGNSRSVVYYQTTNNVITSTSVPSAYSEQSIWPTLGKGIWCGLFFIAVGVFAIISHREKTLIASRMLAVLACLSVFISLFLFLSSILVFQRYIFENRTNANQRTTAEQKEVVLNVLLFICGVLSLIVSLILALISLFSGNFCQSQSDDDEHINNMYPSVPAPPAYSSPGY